MIVVAVVAWAAAGSMTVVAVVTMTVAAVACGCVAGCRGRPKGRRAAAKKPAVAPRRKRFKRLPTHDGL